MSKEKPEDYGRDGIIAELAHQIGGWNASPPRSSGRFRSYYPDIYDDDGAAVEELLKHHKQSVSHSLNEEIRRLKAELYDAERLIKILKHEAN